MHSDITHSVLTILLEISSIAATILTVGHYIGKKFDRVNDKFDAFCREVTKIQLDAQKHVTFDQCHYKREKCPCVQSVLKIQKLLEKNHAEIHVKKKPS